MPANSDAAETRDAEWITGSLAEIVWAGPVRGEDSSCVVCGGWWPHHIEECFAGELENVVKGLVRREPDAAEGRIVVEGDVPKVEPTVRYFTELRASLYNGLDAARDLAVEVERLRGVLSLAKEALLAHPSWCGFNADAPGDGIYNRAMRAIQEALDDAR